MDVCFVIQQRLKDLGLEQRDLAAAAQVTESYISQLLTRKKAPPATNRTDIYEKMNAFLKLPKGQLAAFVEAQRREELQKKLADPPRPLCHEVRELIVLKCHRDRQHQVREIFERHSFGELERLITQKLLDVVKRVAREELQNEHWLRRVAKLRNQSYEEARTISLEFLDTDVFGVSIGHCAAFLGPMIDSWDVDLATFAIEIHLNRLLSSKEAVYFEFAEREHATLQPEPGFQEFLGLPDLSGNATEEEIEFLKGLRFKHNRPSALYYYRELQSLRDPLHFREHAVAPMHKRRDAGEVVKQLQLDTRKSAIRRWAKNRTNSKKKNNGKLGKAPPRRPGRTDLN
jgi:transcriptional regulator with XRE-family HTH domain